MTRSDGLGLGSGLTSLALTLSLSHTQAAPRIVSLEAPQICDKIGLERGMGRVERGVERGGFERGGGRVQDPCKCQHTSAYASIRQHTEEMKEEDLREEDA